MMALTPEATENRKGETWQNLLEQYPNVKFVVSDQGSGLLKGVRDAALEIAHQYDLFTFLHALEERLEKIEIKWRAGAVSRQVIYDAVAQCWYRAARAFLGFRSATLLERV